MDLKDCVRRTIRRYGLASRGTRVLAAVSGGSDSVALAYLLRELDDAGELHLVAIAHFNHQLRDTADRDERFSADVAEALERRFIRGADDVRSRAAREGRSLEDAARAARHEFLHRVRVDASADAIALGHTRDDQAETFLLRLLRGAGARGLASMHPRNGDIVRPLIECRREDLKAYLSARQIAFVHDETNEDVSIPRNRVRAELLPLLESRFNPSVVDALADAADIARDEWTWVANEAAALAARAVRREAHTWTLDEALLGSAPAAVARQVIHQAMTAAAGGRPVAFNDVAQALDLVRFGGSPFDAPGQRVERIASGLVLTGRAHGAVGRRTRDDSPRSLFRYPLSIPGEVALAEAGCAVSVEPAPPLGLPPGAIPGSATDFAVVRRDRCVGGLAVRNRRPGDRFRPLGLGGGKKLQDFFVDRKIDRRLRDRVPIVVDETDHIVWVAGHTIDEDFRVTDPAQAVLILRLKPVGGSV